MLTMQFFFMMQGSVELNVHKIILSIITQINILQQIAEKALQISNEKTVFMTYDREITIRKKRV